VKVSRKSHDRRKDTSNFSGDASSWSRGRSGSETSWEEKLDRSEEFAPSEPESEEEEAGNGDRGDRRAFNVQGLSLIQLEQEEIDFLASPEIAAIAPTTPRSVKRLLNVYRLVRTRIGATGADLMGEKGPAVYPLIALSAALETRQAEKSDELDNAADLFYQALKTLPPNESLVPSLDTPAGPFKTALEACAALRDAVGSVAIRRGGRMAVAELLAVARVARRYSFNREESPAVNRPAAPPDVPTRPEANHVSS
jgi:hypothetical protein